MHKNWCGMKCSECAGCRLDESLPCSPDCELLGEDGTPRNPEECRKAGCDAMKEAE